MTEANARSIRGQWLLWLPFVGTAVLAVAGYYPTERLCGDEGVRAMLIALGLVLAVVYATLFAALRIVGSVDPARRLQIGLKAGTIRLIATCGVIAVAAWREVAEIRALLVWAAIAYVVMIKLETVVFLKWVARGKRRD